ncbi:putative RNA-binding protein [Parafrankia sp. EAN1pec]|uniref:phosphatase PAP2 family protein n=1 Tax=Parafrankia sp. (strain EAN1pec) TaxID=298653 RepID=UPI00005442AD|nr:putative RNA-binding protein [Frankia sp. EAN1pec]
MVGAPSAALPRQRPAAVPVALPGLIPFTPPPAAASARRAGAAHAGAPPGLGDAPPAGAGAVAWLARVGSWPSHAFERVRPRWAGARLGLLAYTVGQVILLGLLYVGYSLSRHLATGREPDALGHAVDVWRLERFLRLPDEASLQGVALAHQWLPHGANWYYVGVHFPAAILLLVWVFARHRDHWRRVRNVIILATGAGLGIHLLYPLAPPRFLPRVDSSVGLVDTGMLFGPSPYGKGSGGVANQYAAMPSLHVGWAILEAWAVVTILRHRMRWLAVIQPLATVAVVVLTANHFWLDGIVGGTLVAGAVLLVGRRRPVPEQPALVSLGFRPAVAPRPAASAGSAEVSAVSPGVSAVPPAVVPLAVVPAEPAVPTQSSAPVEPAVPAEPAVPPQHGLESPGTGNAPGDRPTAHADPVSAVT